MLIHRWPLVSGPEDVVGGLTLTNHGGVTFGSDGAKFNGSSQWLSGTWSVIDPMTMSIWVTPVGKFTDVSRCPFAVGPSTQATMTGVASDIFENLYCAYNKISNSAISDVNLCNYPPYSKTLITLTYTSSGSNRYVYRNDIAICSLPISSNGATGAGSDLAIGRVGAASTYYWYGILADARLYDHALSADEVHCLYLNGPNGVPQYGYPPHIAINNATILPAARGMR